MSLRTGLLIALAAVACGTSQVTIDLSEAVASGDADAVDRLLSDGADPNEPVKEGFTPLMRAVIRGEEEIVGLLLEAGVDVGTTGLSGMTAAHLAAVSDSVGSMTQLADSGADLGLFDSGGMRPIDHAAHHGSVGVIEYLVSHVGVDPDSTSRMFTQGHGYPRDRGPTPLAIATRAGRLDAMRLLLDLGADVDARSSQGQTALLTAIFFDQLPPVAEVLLEAGADTGVTARCIEGCSIVGDLSALEWAIELGRDDLIPLLRNP